MMIASPPTKIKDSKKSFDFMEESKQLSESDASDYRSFVEQLENAFRTPAEVDFRYNFGCHLRVEIPPVSSIPVGLRCQLTPIVALMHPRSRTSIPPTTSRSFSIC